MTIYLFGIVEKKLDVKAIYQLIKDYWADWFPKLPRYQNFNRRINYLASAFPVLCGLILAENEIHNGLNEDKDILAHVLDSMPITVAKHKRSNRAKAAKGLCNKGYCSSKDEYYYGVKLHMLGLKQHKTLPKMRMMTLSAASENDITVAKKWLDHVHNMKIFADKMYADSSWSQLLETVNVHIFTPVKLKKGQTMLHAGDIVLSSSISRARQAIESFFNWIHQMTGIQTASKVRSDNGLISFVFARLAAVSFI